VSPPAWRFLNRGAERGARNMAVDQALMEEVGAGRSAPVLRVYGWAPPAVSLGYGQRPERELNLERCAALGVDVVRRPTGGRAVLHWDELTYSVIVPESEPRLGGAVGDTYRLIGHCLVEGLRRFGVAASLERAACRPAASRTAARAPCFASTARWEVVLAGRKLVGSAQRRAGGAVLQHGSLLLGPQHERVLELLAMAAGPERAAAELQLRSASTYLRACAPRTVEFDELAGCLAAGFAHGLPAVLQKDELTTDEAARVEDLLAAGYAGWGWRREAVARA
jgi:lipoate-protein ligase A